MESPATRISLKVNQYRKILNNQFEIEQKYAVEIFTKDSEGKDKIYSGERTPQGLRETILGGLKKGKTYVSENGGEDAVPTYTQLCALEKGLMPDFTTKEKSLKAKCASRESDSGHLVGNEIY